MALNIVCRTVDLETGCTVSSRAFSLTRESQQWLIRNLTWAVNNGHGIQIFSTKDEKLADKGDADNGR
jgi:hypothetical protein